jgi:AcrR family transcriptional regulator
MTDPPDSPAGPRAAPAERVDGRSLRYQHRRPELLAAAADRALDHGVANLTLRSLAEAIGVSHPTLVHHFGSRENLIAEILEHVRERQRLPGTPGADRLQAVWDDLSTPDGQRQFRLLFEAYGQALISPERFERLLDHVVDDWLEVITGDLTAAGCPPADAPPLATFLIAEIRGLQLDLLATGDRARVDRAFALLLETYRARAAGWQAP